VRRTAWRYILLDQRISSPEILKALQGIAPLAGIDEGGPQRSSFDYLIDTLPRLDGKEQNIIHPGLNPVPKRRRSWNDAPQKPARLLLSFGGEDPAGLTLPTLNYLMRRCGFKPSQIEVAEGPFFAPLELPAGVRRIRASGDLREHLSGYDCLIGSFGLTSLEALIAGTPVLTVNPSRYHARLSRAAGIPSAGAGRPRGRALARGIENFPEIRDECRRAAEVLLDGIERAFPLTDLQPAEALCPGCGSKHSRVSGRDPGRTFYRCRLCGLEYQQRWLPDTTVYDESYFFDEYRKQYGRSYLEDFAHIKAMGRERLRRIRVDAPDPELLDVGCAYGPFLAAAAEEGFRVEGIEPSAAAASWAARKLDAPVHAEELGRFMERNPGRSWDVVTLWYVIEHFPDLEETMALLSRMVRPGGVLAMSTPNAAGISARRNPRRFHAASPADHYTLLTPASLRRLLGGHGFRIESFRSTGLHRDRFPSPVRRLWPLTAPAARTLLLGDTFEIYARRSTQEKSP
jgi:2-polyprenyl-3-methyl-5-hydroxy-6-metoxy-1,4-benzoquinol methylase